MQIGHVCSWSSNSKAELAKPGHQPSWTGWPACSEAHQALAGCLAPQEAEAGAEAVTGLCAGAGGQLSKQRILAFVARSVFAGPVCLHRCLLGCLSLCRALISWGAVQGVWGGLCGGV